MSATSWDTSAGVYSREVDWISFYQVTNQALVAAAEIRPGMTVVDLACGTGFTSRTILDAVGTPIRIYGVEPSCEMLAHAQRANLTESVKFIVARAEEFASHIPVLVDRVVCNAAFFLFPNIAAVLGEIRKVLKPTGLFAFNLPDQEYDFGDGRPSEMAQVVSNYLGPSPLIAARKSERFSYKRIQSLAVDHGFSMVALRRSVFTSQSMILFDFIPSPTLVLGDFQI